MTKIQHILIATDGSEISLRAAALGGEVARAFDARVTIATVNDERAVVPEAWQLVGLQLDGSSEPISTDDIRGRMEQHALQNQLAQTKEATGALPSEPDLQCLWGHPADEIVRFAEENDVGMIVIGSHGRSGIKKALLGSVSHSVANRAPCAVTIVR